LARWRTFEEAMAVFLDDLAVPYQAREHHERMILIGSSRIGRILLEEDAAGTLAEGPAGARASRGAGLLDGGVGAAQLVVEARDADRVAGAAGGGQHRLHASGDEAELGDDVLGARDRRAYERRRRDRHGDPRCFHDR
jgi:hypothetical protein